MRKTTPLMIVLLLAGILTVAPVSARSRSTARPRTIQTEVRHELVLLPYYGVFDYLQYKVDGSKVTLLGFVRQPTLKTEAEAAVKTIEGVASVDNRIQVLPLSPADDRIRMATYRRIYGNDNFWNYAILAVPPIHIIVNNGRVTLEGVVKSQVDKNLAYAQASGTPGTFGVTNNLKVVKG